MKTDPKHPNNIPWYRLARYFAGECSELEKREIKALLKAKPELSEYINVMQQMRDRARITGQHWDLEAEWSKLAERTNLELGTLNLESQAPVSRPLTSDLRPPRPNDRVVSVGRVTSVLYSPHKQFLRIAAVIVGLIGIPYLIYNFSGVFSPASSQQQLTMREVTTERGQRIRLKFADGTSVLLNASSTIRFPDKLVNGTREVHLKGEAYFDVARIENSPFVVHAGDARVQVLGTGFNVKAWPDENNVEVVLARGKVAVRSEKKQVTKEVILAPGQRVEVAQGMAPSDPETVDLDKQLAWVDGRLVFEKSALHDVLKQLERTYDLNFKVPDSTLLSLRLTATFSKDQSLNEILKSISIAINTDVSQSGRVVTLARQK